MIVSINKLDDCMRATCTSVNQITIMNIRIAILLRSPLLLYSNVLFFPLQVQSLEVLDVSCNNLLDVPNEISNLTNLKVGGSGFAIVCIEVGRSVPGFFFTFNFPFAEIISSGVEETIRKLN